MMKEDNVKFKDLPLTIYEPDWDSELAGIVVELEKLRVKRPNGNVPGYIFSQLKEIFQWMESLGSARIEGNHTTLAEFVEKIIDQVPKNTKEEKIREIFNIDRAIDFIDNNIKNGTKITRAHLSEIHKVIVDGLTPPPSGEGSHYPGNLRPMPVSIKGSSVVLPDSFRVPEYLDGLLDFINTPVSPQNDLLVTALAHHRMTWIHPFDNGNGRMIRMFTYAMLIKQNFQVKTGRILNPTAIFCMDREKYYEMLALADTGEKENVLTWCTYVLRGLKEEIEKIDRLQDSSYVMEKILVPSVAMAFKQKLITDREHDILKNIVSSESMVIRSSDLDKIIGQESPVQRSRIIRKLRDKKMLRPLSDNGRVYTISFNNNYLLRSVISMLEANGFIPQSLNENK